MKTRRRAKPDPNPSTPKTGADIPWPAVAAVLAILVLAVYWPVGTHDFVNIDDGLYVKENPVVLRGLTVEGVSWAFTTFHAWNWHPLTWLSHMLDVELFGPAPAWHHRVNVLLHLLNTELLFILLWRMTGGLWAGAIAAALFGVHPLHVESVAWVAERKDVLSTLFWILTMLAYLRYVRRPGAGRYAVLAATFALGLLTKPMLVTLPLALLLLDFWPLGRLAAPTDATPRPSWPPSWPAVRRCLREKVPLLALSAASCVVTYVAQSKGGAALRLQDLPLGSRISNAFGSYAVYLGKTAWPAALAVYYPHPATVHADVAAWKVAGSIVLLCALSALAVWQGRRRPYLATGWLWYLGTLVPVIGLVQAGEQACADRYTYVPLIGIFIAVAWGTAELFSGTRSRKIAVGAVAGAALMALATAARVQADSWRDSVTLFSRALAVTEKNWFAWNNLGVAYNDLGRHGQAADCFREALRIRPGYAEAVNNLGVAYNDLGRFAEAAVRFREALRIRPGYADAWSNLGLASSGLGRDREAVDSFREALRLAPTYAKAWNGLGVSYSALGREGEAAGCFSEAVRIAPRYATAWNNLGASHARLGRYRQAVEPFREALKIEPGNVNILNNLGVTYVALGEYEAAGVCFGEALRLRPDDEAARRNLAAIRSRPDRSR